MDEGPRYLDVPALAARWSMSEKAIWRWKADGKIPFVKLGRSVRFRIDDVETIEAAAYHPARPPASHRPPRARRTTART